MILPRLKPDPIPPIDPVPEYLVTGRRAELYAETKATLQVPWMGVITMALSSYETYYETLWRAVGPMMETGEAVAACARLRVEIEAEVAALLPPPMGDRLAALGYAPREVQGIREAVEVFSHGNFPYTLIVTLSRLALEADRFPAPAPGTLFTGRHAPDVDVPFVLMEDHHADAPLRAIYADIRDRLGLPFVNTDYRALGRWPSCFAEMWGALAPHVQTPEYEAMVARLHHRFVEEAMALPNPFGATVKDLRDAATSAPPGEILEVTRLFQWLLPGLCTNVAFFRAQLQA